MKVFGMTVLAIVAGLIAGKQIAKYAILPLGIPIAAGDPRSEGRKA